LQFIFCNLTSGSSNQTGLEISGPVLEAAHYMVVHQSHEGSGACKPSGTANSLQTGWQRR